jgi:hypothetical protein
MIMTVSIVRIFLIKLRGRRVIFTPGRKNSECLNQLLMPSIAGVRSFIFPGGFY